MDLNAKVSLELKLMLANIVLGNIAAYDKPDTMLYGIRTILELKLTDIIIVIMTCFYLIIILTEYMFSEEFEKRKYANKPMSKL